VDTAPSTTERQPDEVIGQLLGSFQASQAIHVAAKLGLLDMLGEGPRTSEEIARDIGAHEPSLRRLLIFLVTLNILVEARDGPFAATTLGEVLRADHPQSVRSWALLLGTPLIWRPWGDLHATIMTGQPAFERVFGESFFEYLEHSPDDAALFNAAMGSDAGSVPAILDAYDFTHAGLIVDVGGGQGELLWAILQRYPRPRGVLFDLPSVVAKASDPDDPTISRRCSIRGGDMFESVPAGGDIYVLKRIIHDWSDAEATRILRNCQEAMTDGATVLLVEEIVQPTERVPTSDMMMLALVTGRERTEEEFGALYAAAGLRLTRVTPAGEYSIIEGVAQV